jgi:sarcosine oxidase
VDRRSYEAIVVGCGGIGSAALYWLARELGGDVLGIERFRLGHDNGASQDHSRIIRLTYHDPVYVAVAAPAYEHWHVVEGESGVRLLTITGGLDLQEAGTSGIKDVEHCSAALTERGVDHEVLDGAEIRQRWPQWEVPDSVQAVYQQQGGLVDARKANATHIALARARGARVLEETPVLELRAYGAAVDVVTAAGTFSARRVVVAADAWTNQVLAGLGVEWPLTVTQEQVTYFATPHLREFSPDRFPIWIWRAAQEFFGFPVYGEVATKAGQDAGGDEVTATTRTFEPNPRTQRNLREFLERYLPRSLGPELYTKTCLYTMPPDRNFIVGTLPGHPNVAVAIGAGHAFKFAGLLGHILAQLATTGATEYPINAFELDRPALTDPAFPPQYRNELVHSQ